MTVTVANPSDDLRTRYFKLLPVQSAPATPAATRTRIRLFDFRIARLVACLHQRERTACLSNHADHLENLAQAHIFNGMEHRGIEYSVVQGIERGTWKWFAVIDATMTRSGQAKSRLAAVADAKRAIDKAIARRE